MTTIILLALQVLTYAILGRATLSWFTIDPESRLGGLQTMLRRVTDPVLVPVRRLLPRTGRIDLSPLVVLLLIGVVVAPLVRAI